MRQIFVQKSAHYNRTLHENLTWPCCRSTESKNIQMFQISDSHFDYSLMSFEHLLRGYLGRYLRRSENSVDEVFPALLVAEPENSTPKPTTTGHDVHLTLYNPHPYNIQYLIVSSHRILCLSHGRFPRGFSNKIVYVFLVSPILATCTAHCRFQCHMY
jgi:hypothetical protein